MSLKPPTYVTKSISRTALSLYLTAIAAAAAALLAGCSDSTLFTGEIKENKRPVIELTQGPLEGDTTVYSVHFYWIGEDEDGSIDHYEFFMAEGDPVGFDPADTAGAWYRTNLTDSVFTVVADEFDRNIDINGNLYGKFKKTHTFFIRAVDDRGMTSEVAHTQFTAFTYAPHVFINYPFVSTPELGAQALSVMPTFKWYGKDPIDSPWNYQDVDSIRYLSMFYNSLLVDSLNKYPEAFEDKWCDWIWYHAEGDSGTQTTLGDDEFLEPYRGYIIAIQAMDEAGAISSVFNRSTNVRHFRAMRPTGPYLVVKEPFLGSFAFLGEGGRLEQVQVPPGFEMNWSWTGDASAYGGVVQSFRYGWDIANLDDPTEWDVIASPHTTAMGPKRFYSGIHTLYVESVDNLGTKTLATLEVRVIAVAMTRDLLWIDDMPSRDFVQEIYAFPTESAHDEFWHNICMKVSSFDPSTDIYDVHDNDYYVPPMDLVFKYKNIIWSFSKAIDEEAGSVWNRVVYFTPSGSAERLNLNFLPYYLAYGGHLWTEGDGHRCASLAACLAYNWFPVYLRNTVPTWNNPYCENSMAYNDFCVSVLDKADALFPLLYLGQRDVDFDAIRYAQLDDTDSLVMSIEGLPSRLELWEQVTRPGMFFDPFIRGFKYVEFYDPAYYMNHINVSSQSCFHPMYRGKTIYSYSLVYNSAVAFWYSKYAGIEAGPPGCVAAPSVHFGLPLWFFDREQVDSIATAIFNVWQLPLIDE
jgi:hypothetical protein